MNEEAEPAFLSLDQVLKLHRQSLAEHGGLDGLRDAGGIESALASAQNTWYYAGGDLFDIAAAYAFHIAEISSAIAFLTANGCADLADDGVLYDAMIAISARRMEKTGLSDTLRKQFGKS
jgi:death on curing protein